jgi:hypothetical protein
MNRRFLSECSLFLRDHVIAALYGGERPYSYSLCDGAAAARDTTGICTNEILQQWRGDSGRRMQMREDNIDLYEDGGANRGMPSGGLLRSRRANVTFDNNDELGYQRHLEQFETSYMRNLNKSRGHESTAFGVSTEAADSRLLDRKVFRSEGGVEGGIPMREVRLGRRSRVDHGTFTESLRAGGEKGFMLSRYDMGPLVRRVDGRKKQSTHSEEARYM